MHKEWETYFGQTSWMGHQWSTLEFSHFRAVLKVIVSFELFLSSCFIICIIYMSGAFVSHIWRKINKLWVLHGRIFKEISGTAGRSQGECWQAGTDSFLRFITETSCVIAILENHQLMSQMMAMKARAFSDIQIMATWFCVLRTISINCRNMSGYIM